MNFHHIVTHPSSLTGIQAPGEGDADALSAPLILPQELILNALCYLTEQIHEVTTVADCIAAVLLTF